MKPIWIQPICIKWIEFDSIQPNWKFNQIQFNCNFNENINHVESKGEKYCVQFNSLKLGIEIQYEFFSITWIMVIGLLIFATMYVK